MACTVKVCFGFLRERKRTQASGKSYEGFGVQAQEGQIAIS